jgi:hypothetical protein
MASYGEIVLHGTVALLPVARKVCWHPRPKFLNPEKRRLSHRAEQTRLGP